MDTKKRSPVEEKVHKIIYSYNEPSKIKEETFKEIIDTLNLEELKVLLEILRKEITFYIKVSKEDYRKKNPKSHRYIDAYNNYDILNNYGLTVKQKINSLKN